jgi:quercetin dioxygenase-like cupin family protein
MPIEIRRFGVGHRRPDGPAGSDGVESRVIEARASGSVTELAFGRVARLVPHASPRWTCFLVIEGGGWTGVGDERCRVGAGEAAVWPPDVLHAAWTDGTPMRAIVVELAEDPRQLSAVVDGLAGVVAGAARPVTRGEGRLADRPRPRRSASEADEGEPL